MEHIVSVHESLNRDSGMMEGGQGRGGWEDGGWRRREAWRRPHQDKGRGRGETKGVNESES